MKNLKKLKSLVMLLVLAFCGSAFAAVTLPSTSAPTTVSLSISSATTATEWKRIGQNIGNGVTDVIISVQSDVDFGGSSLPTILMNNANVYFIGGSPTSPKQVTISGLKQQKSLFNNVGKTVLVKDLIFKDVEIDFTEIDTAASGLFFKEVKVDDFVVQNVKFDDAKASIRAGYPGSSYTRGGFGLLAGRVSGRVEVSDVTLNNFSVDTAYVANIGSLFGFVSGEMTLGNVQTSGKMNVLAQEDSENKGGIGVGGLVGFVQGDVSANNVKSGMAIDVIENKIETSPIFGSVNKNAGVGGFFGKVYNAQGTVSILGSEFTGEIQSFTEIADNEMGIGGIAGIVKDCEKSVKVNNVNVSLNKNISHTGSRAYVGGVFGAVKDNKNVEVALSHVEGAKILLDSQTDDNAATVGGVIGFSDNTAVVIKKVVVTSAIEVDETGLDSDVGVFVGGAIGAFWNTKNKKSLWMDSVVFDNGINISVAKGFDEVALGGLLGQASNIDSLVVSRSSIRSSADTVFYVALGDNAVNTFAIGGLIGNVSNSTYLGIDSSFVKGYARYTFGSSSRNSSYVSGLVGFANSDSVSIKNFMYDGDVVLTNQPPKYLVGSSVMSGKNESDNQGIQLQNGYVICNIETSLTNRDAKIDSSHVLVKTRSSANVSVSEIYELNSEDKIWYFDNGKAALMAFCEEPDVCLAPGKVVFTNLKGENSNSVVYSDKKGKWTLNADGNTVEQSDFPSYTGAKYNSKGDSVKAWIDSEKNIWSGEGNLADGQIFSEESKGVAIVVLKTDMTKSGGKIEIIDNPGFDVTKDSVMPWYVFENGQDNGLVKYSKSNVWMDANGTTFADVASLKNFLATYARDTIILVAEGASNRTDSFVTKVELSNVGETKFRIKSLGLDDTLVFNGNNAIFPKMTEMEIIEVANGLGCFRLFVNEVLVDSITLNQTIDTTQFADEDRLRLFAFSCPEPPVEPDPENPENPDPNKGNPDDDNPNKGNPDEPAPDMTPVCVNASKISNVYFAKSGKSAALFEFKLSIPDSCDMLTPSASVKGPNGLVWYSSFASKTDSYSFNYYPLEPGTYKFNIKLASGKDTTFTKRFDVDMYVQGHKWSLAAIGSWPKGVLKNDDAKIYEWNQETLIGDYWQYDALPDVEKVVENTGYWIYAEKNLEFSLDLPLKKAEGDFVSWDLKKNFNGWNLIANPYSWDLEATSTKNFMDPESDESPFWRLNSDGEFEVASVIGANEALWISTDKNRTIKVSSKPVFPSAKASSKKSLKKASTDSWSMALVAKSENGHSDSWNVLGVGSKDIALEEPPAGNDFVSVSFEGDNKAPLAKRILAKTAGEYAWNVNLKASESGKVNLSLEGLDEVRAMGYKAVLVMDGETFEFGSDASVSVDASENSRMALLKVVPANMKVVAASGISDVRYGVVNGWMDVQFSVPFEMAGRSASAYLMDVNGRVISKAFGKASAASNVLRLASPVHNGVYILQVRVGSDVRSLRLAL